MAFGHVVRGTRERQPLLWGAVWRNPAETLLTWLAATVAFALFSLMVRLHVHTRQLIEGERKDRLYVVMRYPAQPFTGLPVALAGQIARSFYETMAFFVTAMMSVGALFGAVNILSSSVRARTREIGILRAIGYAPIPLAASVTLDSLLLSLAGALVGAMLAWSMFNGRESISDAVFRWSISPRLLALGVAWALALAFIGSLFPAIRAGRLPVSIALHE
jgi:cell division protein FtsX